MLRRRLYFNYYYIKSEEELNNFAAQRRHELIKSPRVSSRNTIRRRPGEGEQKGERRRENKTFEAV